MEPAARTVASGPEWPMRAGGRGRAALGHSPDGSARAGVRSAPTGVGGHCAHVLQGAQPGAVWWASGLAPLCINRGVGLGERPSGTPYHQASGLRSPVGQVAVACACEIVDLWVLRLPCPIRREARLSRPCPRRVGVVAL